MAIAIRQLHPHFVGEVSGVDLRKPLTRQEAIDIEAGMDKYAVLLFRDQDITDEQQMAFALNFGERENPRGGNIVKPQDSRLASTGLNDVSNLGRDGKPLPRDSRVHLFNLGNCLWHSDSSFRPIPAKFSLLSARVLSTEVVLTPAPPGAGAPLPALPPGTRRLPSGGRHRLLPMRRTRPTTPLAGAAAF